MPEKPRRPWQNVSRDMVLYVLGIAIVLNEEFVRVGVERPSMLLFAAGLVGLPTFLRRNGGA